MSHDFGELLALATELQNPARNTGDSEARFNIARDEFVRDLLSDGGDPGEIAPFLVADLDALTRHPETDPHAAAYVREALLTQFAEQSRRNAARRRVIALIPTVLLILATIAYFSYWYSNLIWIDQPIESGAGLVQRAAAVEKVIRYESWAEAKIQRGRFILLIIIWPIKPTDSEVTGASEFARLTLQYVQQINSEPGCEDVSYDNEFVQRFTVDATARAVLRDQATGHAPSLNSLRKGIHDRHCLDIRPADEPESPKEEE
ncbi:hypothetical protein [Sphingomonas sp.]|uniref:hypothetical protein n=1 Tax=Sphingomonas sp. TaxID=28214 RepID=UPI003D6D20E9